MSHYLAPNGKPSNLTHEQWHLVRTPEFKAWFGDWENDPANASKVVDENGEPLVVYHGVKNDYSGWNVFKVVNQSQEVGVHFGTYDQAMAIVKDSDYFPLKIFSCFIRVINILKVDDLTSWTPKNYEFIFRKNNITYNKSGSFLGNSFTIPTDVINAFNNINVDGLMYDNIYEGSGVSYIVFEPEQIKLADGTNTTFDGSNPDIRFDGGGEVNSNSFMKWYVQWYKGISDKMNIVFSLPSVIAPYKEENVVVLDVFEKINQNIDAKPYLKEIVENADEYGVVIYLEPTPRHNRFQDNLEKKKKITREYLIEYYKRFGFQLTPNKQFMKRLPKSNPDIRFKDGGLIAPNGKPSNLTAEQYKLVRTKAFKDWFGDWEKSPHKYMLTDENGEPMVWWHTGGDWNELINGGIGGTGKLMFSPTSRSMAYGKAELGRPNITRPFFIKSDYIYILPYEDRNIPSAYRWNKNKKNPIWFVNAGFIVVRQSHQIKLADGTNTTFDGSNPDIRFKDGGATMKKVDKGGITYGKSHDEGGIPVKNASTGQMLEVEGGEGIVNKRSMASDKMVKLNGKQMTICEAVSQLNQMEGGVKFSCDDVEHRQFIEAMELGGELERGVRTEKEHIETLRKLYEKRLTPTEAVTSIAKEHIAESPTYYTDLENMNRSASALGMSTDALSNMIFDFQAKRVADRANVSSLEIADSKVEKFREYEDGGMFGRTCGCRNHKRKYLDGGMFDSGFGSLDNFIGQAAKKEESKKDAEYSLEVIDKARKLLDKDYLQMILSSSMSPKYKIYFQHLKKLNLYQEGWRFKFGQSREWAGLCAYKGLVFDKSKTLYLSINFVKHDENWLENEKDTILHEMAHAIVDEYMITKVIDFLSVDPAHKVNEGHGEAWEQVCKAINPEGNCGRFYNNAKLKDSFLPYMYECGFCSTKKYSRNRNFTNVCFKCMKPVIVTKND